MNVIKSIRRYPLYLCVALLSIILLVAAVMYALFHEDKPIEIIGVFASILASIPITVIAVIISIRHEINLANKERDEISKRACLAVGIHLTHEIEENMFTAEEMIRELNRPLPITRDIPLVGGPEKYVDAMSARFHVLSQDYTNNVHSAAYVSFITSGAIANIANLRLSKIISEVYVIVERSGIEFKRIGSLCEEYLARRSYINRDSSMLNGFVEMCKKKEESVRENMTSLMQKSNEAIDVINEVLRPYGYNYTKRDAVDANLIRASRDSAQP